MSDKTQCCRPVYQIIVINKFALFTLNCYIGLLPYEPKELDDMESAEISDDEFKMTRKAANMNRLYLRRNRRRRLGRELMCLEENAEVMLVKLYKFLNENSNTQALVEHERKEATHMGLIQDYFQKKYNLNEEEVNAKKITSKHEERIERSRAK